MNRRYEVYAPHMTQGGTRAFSHLGEGELALTGDRPPDNPKGIFYPSSQQLFRYQGQNVTPGDSSPDRPISVFGLSAADAAAVAYLDRFFTSGYVDDLFLERRKDAVVATLVGETDEGDFSPAATPGLFDLQFASVGDELFVNAGSLKGATVLDVHKQFFEPVEDERAVAHYLRERSHPSDSMRQIARAAVLLRAGRVADDFWQWVADRCLSCGGCSYVCPTCTCFDVWDRGTKEAGERIRCWDSCILSGFTREGSDHNPRGLHSQRNRRSIEHKLLWEGPGPVGLACVGCGRCEDVCPSSLGMPTFAREIVQRADERGKVMLDVLDRAAEEPSFMASLATGGADAFAAYDLTPLEQAAIQSGDIRWIESFVTKLDDKQKVWMTARLEQEHWGFEEAQGDAESSASITELPEEPPPESTASAVDEMAWSPDWLLTTESVERADLKAVLERAARDLEFGSRLLTAPSEALEDYHLTDDERAAIASGDIRWIEAREGPLTEEQSEWLYRRLAVEAW